MTFKEAAFIGPLGFQMKYEDAFMDMRFPETFLGNVWTNENEFYDVEVISCDGICPDCFPGEAPTAETMEFTEYLRSGTVIRYYFGYIDHVRRCYGKILLRDHDIKVYFDTAHGWPKGKIRVIWQFLLLEKLLAWAGAIILHSASVVLDGKAVLFSGPSGAGKSTQADLWKKYVPGTIGFNGDRNLLIKRDGVWYVCGLPWHGTSNDCENGLVPLAGIALLKQETFDMVSELHPMEKFKRVFGEITRNDWDHDYAVNAIDAVQGLVTDVSMCELSCTIGEGSVRCLGNWLGL